MVREVEKFEDGSIRYIMYRNNRGVPHREDGPSYESWYSNGNREMVEYIQDDIYTRLDGPAYQHFNINGVALSTEYMVNGKVHREDGYAYIQLTQITGKIRNKSYYLYDIELTQELFVKKLKEINSPHYEKQKMIFELEKYNI